MNITPTKFDRQGKLRIKGSVKLTEIYMFYTSQ